MKNYTHDHLLLEVKNKPKKLENAIIQQKILDFNDSILGKSEDFSVFIKETNGKIHGGIIIQLRLKLKLLYIDYLWVTPKLRNKGFGAKLVNIAEQIAINKGCNTAELETLEFQAEKFYQKLGYHRFGLVKQYMSKFDYFFMKKIFYITYPPRSFKETLTNQFGNFFK